jgi:2-amino-4-hydroxy-6-hydroxymethyldihydropteridine diphosphokinase
MTAAARIPVALALGANLGDRAANLDRAVALLAAGPLRDVRHSRWYPSAPLECRPGAPPFLNGALIGTTALTPDELLAACQQTEAQLGRPAQRAWHADRPLDVDILLYGQLVLDTPALRVPHPELHRRDFVLVPLAEVAPDWLIPGPGLTVAQCLARLPKA